MCVSPRVSLRAGALVCLALLAAGGVARADQEVARTPIVDAPPGTPGIGGGFRFSSSPYVGVGTVPDLVPLIRPRVRRFGVARDSGLQRNGRLTVHEDSDFACEALATGARGFVVKPRLVTDLPVAIKEVLASRSFVSPSISLEDDN